MNIRIIFERENENNPLEKTIVLKAKIKTSLGRKNKTISETAFTQPYRIHQRVFNKLFQTADRGDWEKVKNHFSILLDEDELLTVVGMISQRFISRNYFTATQKV